MLLAWENEAYLALDEFGADKFDIVYPPTSILAEPPVAVVDANVDAKGTRKVAEPISNYLYSPEGQTIIAKNHYRPSKPELVPTRRSRQASRRSSWSPSTIRCSAAGRRRSRTISATAAYSTRSTSRPSKPGSP